MSYKTLLTDLGRQKVANAIANGTKINLVEMAFGDGNGAPVTIDATQTTLVNEVHREDLGQVRLNQLDDVVAESVITNDVGGFTIRELGIYDSDGDLFAVGSTPAIPKPTVSENTAAELVIRVVLKIDSTQAITLTAGNTVIATQDWVNLYFVPLDMLRGGSTGSVLGKKSNADHDFEWLDLGDGINVNVQARVEEQTLALNQTDVTLATLTTDGVAVYIEGAREFGFTIVNDTQLTLDQSYPDGTQIWFVQNEPIAQKAEYRPIAGGQTFQITNRYFVTDDNQQLTMPDVTELNTGAAVEVIRKEGIAPRYVVNGSQGEQFERNGQTDTAVDHIDNIKAIFVYNKNTNKWEF